MAELNLIKTKQLDLTDFGNYFSQLMSGEFAGLLNTYLTSGGNLGVDIVYATNTDQTISGTKTFVHAPYVPYTGTSGQSVAKQYIDDNLVSINAGLNSLLNSKLVYTTGNRSITGNSIFNSPIYVDSLSKVGGSSTSIDIATSSFYDSVSALSLNWESRTLNGDWTINGLHPIYSESSQVITGVKTFTGGIKIPETTTSDFAVPYGQFKNEVDSLRQDFVDTVAIINTGTTSGFAGVLGINRASGHIFTQGRGTVTVWQQGNILNISGATLNHSGSSIQTYKEILTSGSDSYDILLDGFSSTPFILAQLGTNVGTSDHVVYHISNVNATGFTVQFSDKLAATGYYINYLALDSTGLFSYLKGEQGERGQSLNPRGSWVQGTSYGVLDFVSVNGVSWSSIQTHTSNSINSPTGISGFNYWQMLASGSGPKGDAAVLFNYKGYWDTNTTYKSGDGVSFSGATFGTMSDTFAGQKPTGAPWYLLTDKGDKGDGFYYQGAFSPTTMYKSGDVVFYNNASHVYTGATNLSGNEFNPSSLRSPWKELTARQLNFAAPYVAQKVFYKNDLVGTSVDFNADESSQYVWTLDFPVKSLHPYGHYNIFQDCDGFTGKNLFEVRTGLKNTYHPLSGVGSTAAFEINGNTVNHSGSGIGTLVLIRGQKYYFDSELTSVPFILTTDATGNGYNGQINTNVFTGTRLSAADASYTQMGLNQSLYSGTMLFKPDVSTPNELYYQCPAIGGMGWKIVVVDKSPWSLFTSGTKGDKGLKGDTGNSGPAGLAFAWKGEWNPSLPYSSGSAVYYNGSSYGTNQTANIGTTPPAAPWEPLAVKGADGEDAQGLAFVWQGNWSATKGYKPYDAVYYAGSSYATTGSPSGDHAPNITPASWFVVASKGADGTVGAKGDGGLAFTWRGDYNDLTTYTSGESVYYAGSSYGHTGISSTLGVEPDYTGANPWTVIARGGGVVFSWRGTWDGAIQYYSGDSVYYNGSSYATTGDALNIPPANGNPWFLVAQKGDRGSVGITGPKGDTGPQGTGGLAFVWKGNWQGGTNYAPNDSVYFNGSSYATLTNVTGTANITPPNSSTKWFPVAKQGDAGLAFTWKGNWNSTTLYKPNDAVYFNGRSYATQSPVATGFSPDQGVWFVVAERGGTVIDDSIYVGSYTGGYFNYEKFVSRPITITGAIITMISDVAPAAPINVTLYHQTTGFDYTTICDFVLSDPDRNVVSGNLNYTTTRLGRIGVDILEGDLRPAESFVIGFFGVSAD